MFVNCSNHMKEMWSEKQNRAAATWGTIVDCPFPNVPADWSEEKIEELADETVEKIMQLGPDAVLCQGEFSLTFAIVKRLLKKGIVTLSACSERRVTEEVKEDGTIVKHSNFQFVCFRRYCD